MTRATTETGNDHTMMKMSPMYSWSTHRLTHFFVLFFRRYFCATYNFSISYTAFYSIDYLAMKDIGVFMWNIWRLINFSVNVGVKLLFYTWLSYTFLEIPTFNIPFRNLNSFPGYKLSWKSYILAKCFMTTLYYEVIKIKTKLIMWDIQTIGACWHGGLSLKRAIYNT